MGGGDLGNFASLLSARAFSSFCAALGVLFLFVLMQGSILARVSVKNFDGEEVFSLRFLSDDFTTEQIEAITTAAQYWVDILKPRGTMPVGGQGVDIDGNLVSGPQPVVINVGTVDGNNASSYNMLPIESGQLNNPFLVTPSMKLLADGTYVDPNESRMAGGNLVNAHGVMAIGYYDTSSAPLSQTGRVQRDLMTTVLHEFGHTLGISASGELNYIDEERQAELYKFSDILTRWDSHLRDNNGNSAVPGAYPNVDGKPIDDDPTNGGQYIFDMGDPNSPTQPANFTFVGKNVLELLYGKPVDKLTEEEKNHGVALQGLVLNDGDNDGDGIPNYLEKGADRWIYDVNGEEETGNQVFNTLSNINARNSLMSGQTYRNYPMFLEVELAAMQDLGYDIDRSSFFGRSFYVNGDGTPFYNSATFASLSAYGVGAHLFADTLNIIQTGSIQASGPGAAGIRVDGVGNTLTIPYGTTVYSGLPADYIIPTDHVDSFRNYGVSVLDNGVLETGIDGTGLLVAYGKDHQIIHRGGEEWNRCQIRFR
ncbi:MAG: hypothetical protein LBN39_13730 [Planctomycetaceae bacterium]|nr:hypothetical protein [Planctomycetaceae bacterium]